MHKIHNIPDSLPLSILQTIDTNSPIPGSTHESCHEWLLQFQHKSHRSSVFYKGPLFYSGIKFEPDHDTENQNLFKTTHNHNKSIKTYLLERQKSGDSNEWEFANFDLYNVPGLRRSNRTRRPNKR